MVDASDEQAASPPIRNEAKERHVHRSLQEMDNLDIDSVRVFKQCEILRDVDDASLRAFAAMARRRSYGRDELILREGDRTKAVVFIAGGTAQAYRLSPEGREITVARLQPGEVFGLEFLDTRSKSFLKATSARTTVWSIPLAHFRRFLLTHPNAALNVAELLGRRLVETRDLLEEVALYDIETRLEHALVRLASRHPDRVVSETHEELAHMIGARREHVTRSLRHLRARGVVEYEPHGRRIVVRAIGSD